MDKLITDNSAELLKITYDGERFGLIYHRKRNDLGQLSQVTILNKREAQEIADFIKENNGS